MVGGSPNVSNNLAPTAHITTFKAAIRYELGEQHEFIFVEGSVPCPPSPDLRGLIPDETECFSYFESGSIAGYLSALEDLEDYIVAEGPFEAVMAFSQGASLAATLMAWQAGCRNPDARTDFQCAVFICGAQPSDRGALKRGALRELDAMVDGELIQAPAAIITGSKDPFWKKSLALSKLFCTQSREVVDHGGGHEIPTASKRTTLEMVDAINKVIGRGLSAQ